MQASPGVILLMGATATGKTDLALALSQRFDVEIISVDSALIFRDMNIGTAKPEADVLASVPHHLIDIIDPAEAYSVWDFVEQSRRLVDDIVQRGRIPLLAGGTMMYFHAFEQGLNRLPAADPELRKRLDREVRNGASQRCTSAWKRLILSVPGASRRPIHNVFSVRWKSTNSRVSRCLNCSNRKPADIRAQWKKSFLQPVIVNCCTSVSIAGFWKCSSVGSSKRSSVCDCEVT